MTIAQQATSGAVSWIVILVAVAALAAWSWHRRRDRQFD